MCKIRRSSKTLPVYLHLKFPMSRTRGPWRPAGQGGPGAGRHNILCLAFTEAFACAAAGRALDNISCDYQSLSAHTAKPDRPFAFRKPLHNCIYCHGGSAYRQLSSHVLFLQATGKA